MNKISPNRPALQKTASRGRQKKEKIVAKLAEKIGKAKGLVFTNYQGLTHKQLEKLKKAVKQANAELVVTKNTLLKLALLNSKLPLRLRFSEASEARNSKQRDSGVANAPQNDVILASKRSLRVQNPFRISDFQAPTATLFLYGDPIGPLKEIAKAIKEFSLPIIKFGILDGEAVSGVELLKISALPSREALLSQLVFGLKYPISGLHRALNWNLQKFVITLKAIESKKNS